MEARYVDTKRGLAATWAGFGLLFGSGFSLLMGDSLTQSVSFGVAIGLGFALAVALFFKGAEWPTDPPSLASPFERRRSGKRTNRHATIAKLFVGRVVLV